MQLVRNRRSLAALIAMLAVAGTALAAARLTPASPSSSVLSKLALGDIHAGSQGTENGGAGGESAEMLRAMNEFAEARTAPSGIVAPGAYTSAFRQLTDLGTPVGGTWSSVTGPQGG